MADVDAEAAEARAAKNITTYNSTSDTTI